MNHTITQNSLIEINPFLTSILIAIVIFLGGLILGRILGKLIEKFLKDFKIDSNIKKKTNIKLSIGKLLSVFIQASIYIIFAVLALNHIGITSLLLNIIFIAIIIVLSISFLLALKDSLPNMIAGLTLRKKSNLKLNTKININNIEGTIIELNLFEVKIEKTNKDILHIPNSLFVKSKYITKNK